ncbi:MAG: LysM domain-containing protein [Burkholderiales bacterium]|nr:LysM domain-containing protein [Burkholderiales bacterium]
MTKSSIAAVWLAAAALSLGAAANAANPCVILSSAPDSHTVQQGDTLWDIAARFLQNPWCWREVWSNNQVQIRDPHWIYPGQRIVLDRTLGVLSVAAVGDKATATPAVSKLSPTARVVITAHKSAIPAIDPRLASLAARYRLVSATTVADAPRIVGLSEGRRLLLRGDIVFTTKPPIAGETFDVMRALMAPAALDGGELPAVPLLRIGQVRRQAENPTQFLVVHADAELSHGDLLLPVATQPPTILMPQAAPPLEGKILAVLRESRWASQHDVVALDRGLADGLRAGSVVEVLRPDRMGGHENRSPKPAASSAQTASIGALLVFEALEHEALALVMRSRDALGVGYLIHSSSPNERP